MPYILSLKSFPTLEFTILTLAYAVFKARLIFLTFNNGHRIFKISLIIHRIVLSSKRRFASTIHNALAFTSVGVGINNQAIQGSGLASFRVHGALHHLMGALMPAEEVEPSYAQLYIYDPQEANDRCVCRNSLLNPEILLDLSTTLSASHSYAEVYKQAYEIMRVSSIVFFLKHKFILYV